MTFSSLFSLSFRNFRYVFQHIQSQVRRKFGDDNIVRYTSISGFIFLRFFCPALLTPKNFGLLDGPLAFTCLPRPHLLLEHPPVNVARDLTLIAKVIQNMANLVPFGKKEPFMMVCNDFINDQFALLKTFLDTLSSNPTEAIDEIPSKRSTLYWGREMSRVHSHLVEALERTSSPVGELSSDRR